ncbi:probable strigolactone esterase DAD2 [Malania oleifera]|uniref:probable strigolactone esterase DAD2 n=1 Tax=Malania oleifera TaxID=397392 RepID=UPI0025ADFAA4|nr:probable strigolactone esterase DAD2 [Malania oleifera]
MEVEKGQLAAAMKATIVGSGIESIILGHGYGADQSFWAKILPALAGHFRVLLFDWAFSGAVEDPTLFDPEKHSSLGAFADDLIALVDEVGFGPSVFVGHSMSGMIGCIASVKRPELFKRLVLIGASPRYINLEDYEGGFEKSNVEEMLTRLELDYDKWASFFSTFVVGAHDLPSVNLFYASLKRMRPKVTLSVAKTIFYGDYRDVLPKVVIPCTIIQTANDAGVPISVAHYMHDKIGGESTVEMVEFPGHYPQLSAPQLLLDVLGRVLGF